jgi:hypothetical protein
LAYQNVAAGAINKNNFFPGYLLPFFFNLTHFHPLVLGVEVILAPDRIQ